MRTNQTILFMPPVHWDCYSYRDQELPAYLAEKGFSCIYLNPVAYKGSELAGRFAHVNQRNTPASIKIIDRSSRFKKSLFELIYENWLNVKAIKEHYVEVVISTDHLMSLASCIYCKIRGIKFIFDVTDNWELVDTSIAGKFYKYIAKPLLARFSFAICCASSRQYAYFRKQQKDNTHLISNAISPLIQEEFKKKKSDFKLSNQVNFIGSLRDWYDFDLLFELFQELPQLQLNIYGLGPLYMELLEKSKVHSNIQVLGNLEQHETPIILLQSLFGIIPLKNSVLNHSTCPIKLFDYWGAGKAVIAPPLEDIKRVGGKSLLYASTKQEYLESINLLLRDEELRGKLGAEGKDKIQNTHNYDYIAKQFLQIINKY